MPATTSVEASTVYVVSNNNSFRIWFNPAGYWQTDIKSPKAWLYFAQAHSLIQAMTNIAITL